MDGQAEAAANANEKGNKQPRQRSTIAFPYDDLNSALDLANAIHNHVGPGECEDDQLAAWTSQSPKSSTFRIKVYAARIFGVLDGEGSKNKLSELGHQIVDPNQAREARVRAFLNVPLYKAIFERHKGGVLPPAAALEREMVQLGVSEKQKDRARQIFERAADQAGFFEHGKNRLVMPGIHAGSRESIPPPRTEENQNNNGGSGGGNGSGPTDPLIEALIQKLPKSGKEWKVEERIVWLQNDLDGLPDDIWSRRFNRN